MSLIAVSDGNTAFYMDCSISTINEMMANLDKYNYFRLHDHFIKFGTSISEDKFINLHSIGPPLRFIMKPSQCIYAHIIDIDAYCIIRHSMDSRWLVSSPSSESEDRCDAPAHS